MFGRHVPKQDHWLGWETGHVAPHPAFAQLLWTTLCATLCRPGQLFESKGDFKYAQSFGGAFLSTIGVGLCVADDFGSGSFAHLLWTTLCARVKRARQVIESKAHFGPAQVCSDRYLFTLSESSTLCDAQHMGQQGAAEATPAGSTTSRSASGFGLPYCRCRIRTAMAGRIVKRRNYRGECKLAPPSRQFRTHSVDNFVSNWAGSNQSP